MCTHNNDIAALLCHLGALGRQNWYTGMDAGEKLENEGGGAETESGSGQTAPEKLDLLAIIRSLPAEDLARCIPPVIFDRVREVSKEAGKTVDEKQIPREFCVNKVWWAACQDSLEKKQNFVLDQLSKQSERNIITSIIVPECLPSNSIDASKKLAEVLSHCPDLTHLDLSQNRIEWHQLYQAQNEWNSATWRCTSLTHLDLNHCSMFYEGLRTLHRILAQWKCEKLAFLDLGGNKLLGADFKELLQQFTELRHLNLSTNCIDENQTQKIAEGLNTCTTLTHLDLSANHFGVTGMQNLAPVLRQCSQLTHLVLSGTRLNTAGVQCLHGVLSGYRNLLHINLASNEIKFADMSGLLNSLQYCNALAYLNLSWNTFDCRDTNLLNDLSSHFPMLNDLHLAGVGMGVEGVTNLAGHLSQYTALKHLDIGYNHFVASGALSLAEVLPRCNALLSLDVSCNAIGYAAQNLVDACLVLAAQKDKFELTLINNEILPSSEQRLLDQCRGTNLVLKFRAW